jgi:hypothetical protein
MNHVLTLPTDPITVHRTEKGIGSAICCAFGSRVGPRETFAIGISTAFLSLVVKRFLWNFVENKVGVLATFHGIPILVAGLLALALGYTRHRLLNVAD